MTSILSAPKSLHFGFLTSDEIRHLSVAKLSNPVTFDSLGHATPNGLYDIRLGPTEMGQGLCQTCGANFNNCPGHAGHIELAAPVYHPLLLGNIQKILQAKCFSCHRFRLRGDEAREFEIKMKLLEAGMIEEALNMKDRLDEKNVHDLRERESIEMSEMRREKVFKEYEAKLANVVESPEPTTHYRSVKRDTVNDLLRRASATLKCGYCGQARHKIRKAGNTKLFMAKPSKKGKRNGSKRKTLDDEADEVDQEMTKEEEESEEVEGNQNEQYMPSTVALEEVSKLWRYDDKTLAKLYFGNDPQIFFVETLFVPPSRFRPARMTGSGMVIENDQTKLFVNVLLANELFVNRAEQFRKERDDAEDDESESEERKRQTTSMYDWVNLQEKVNVLMDETKTDRTNVVSDKDRLEGIRQGLEKKEGLFRQNLMGKRVNFAARSVISPDPMIGTDEVGVPLKFAKVLTYPEPVTEFNVEELAHCVRNGADVHPGAVYVEDSSGRLIDLRKRNQRQRNELASRLEDLTRAEFKEERLLKTRRETLKGDNAQEASWFNRVRSEARASAHALGGQYKVWRHLRNGDALLANRQPTLHKSSIMAHRARVINNPKMETIRLHYANCYTYNADFDGDEINLHFPQSELARAEAYEIAYTNHQYCAPTDGVPMRGLIQDHIAMGVLLTKKDTFFTREEFVQNVYSAAPYVLTSVEIPPPAILTKKQRLWTGKQLLSAVLKRVVPKSETFCLMNAKPKTPGTAFQIERTVPPGEAWGFDGPLSDSRIIFRHGDLVTGILDKNSYGNSSKYGFVHSIFEAYGAHAAGDLLSALGRLFTQLERTWGHTCGIDDLMIVRDAELKRTEMIKEGEEQGVMRAHAFVLGEKDPAKFESLKEGKTTEDVRSGLAQKLNTSSNAKLEEGMLDGAMGGVTSKVQSNIMKVCVPFGQAKRFPKNNFALMVLTGAKGSNVNQTQISCLLGQQSLEGKRVPRMSSGKTLPCFDPFDPTPRAGGFVTNRFLSGIRAQEYYFHCMAGREGLLDTAVKTARSGYLQRCMVKHLEHLKVEYDGTVRADDGSIVQFRYGDDGLDAMNMPYLAATDETLKFLSDNRPSFYPPASFLQSTSSSSSSASSSSSSKKQKKKRSSKEESDGDDEILKSLPEGLKEKVHDYLARDPFKDFVSTASLKDDLKRIVEYKYQKSLVAPGEPVGVLAAQGIGEPSTQMTLNTFHLAGHAEKNVTLGIPRLRELLWASSPGKTPTIRFPCGSMAQAEQVSNRLSRVLLSDLLLCDGGGVQVREVMVRRSALSGYRAGKDAIKALKQEGVGTGQWFRRYFIQYRLESMDVIKEEFGFGMDRISEAVSKRVVNKLCLMINKELKRLAGGLEVAAAKVSSGKRRKGGSDGEDDEEDAAEADALAGDGIDDDEDDAGEDDDEDEEKEKSTVVSSRKRKSEEKERSKTVGDDDDETGDKTTKKKEKAKKTKGKKGSSDEYEDEDDESVGEEDDEDEGDSPKKKSKKTEGDDEDDESEEEGEKLVTPEEGEKKSSLSSKKSIPKSYSTFTKADESEEIRKVETNCDAQCLLGVSACSSKSAPYVEICLEFPAEVKRLLLIDIVENLAQECAVRSVEGILDARPTDEDGKYFVDISGASSNKFDIKTMFRFSHLGDVNKLDCNDVNAVLKTLGVEAARACLIRQFKAVFDPYGIEIDERHLSLVADHMLFEGTFRAMNRKGVQFSVSPFVKITFETAVKFVLDAALLGEKDDLETPSARIASGQVIRSGTGSVGVLVRAVKERR